MKQSISATKAQEELRKVLLQFETSRCHKTFWNENPKLNPWTAQKKSPLQHSILIELEHLMQSDQCLKEIGEEAKEISTTMDKIHEQCKHWDQAYQQYQVNNYLYIDSQGIVHKNTIQYLDNHGRVHTTPMQYVDTEGKLHTYEQLINSSQPFKLQPVDDKHRCYRKMLPCHRNPNLEQTQKYFQRRKLSYIAARQRAVPHDKYDKDEEISKLQQQLSNQITDNVWRKSV